MKGYYSAWIKSVREKKTSFKVKGLGNDKPLVLHRSLLISPDQFINAPIAVLIVRMCVGIGIWADKVTKKLEKSLNGNH